MIRNKLLIVLSMTALMALSSCGTTPHKPGGNMDRPITYDEIYHGDTSKHEHLTGQNVYKASYGYLSNDIQGYNQFYYLYGKDGSYQEMDYKDNKWCGNESTLDGKLMTSTSNEYAVRKFIAPASGTIKLTANPRLITQNPIALDVIQNGELLFTEAVTSRDGYYQEKEIVVNENDEILFVNRGEGTIAYNPKLDYFSSPDGVLHTTADGYYGDIHPFYDYKNKKMYMYYLSTGNQSQSEPVKLYSSLCTSSSDMFNYYQTSIQVDENSKPESTLFYVLGVYEDIDGNYRSCFGVSDHAGASMSKDLLTWSNGADMYFDDNDNFKYHFRCYFGSIAGCGRDPDIYYDCVGEKYYCIALTYKATSSQEGSSGEKHLTVYEANSAGTFSEEGKHLIDFTGRGDPECPQVKYINHRWYIFYSIYGTGTAGNVGKLAYRVGDYNVGLMDVDWNNKTELFLDGGDLHAAQVVNVGNKLYTYGWINYIPYTNVWGGYLNLPHEIYQDDEGFLCTRLDEKATDLLKKGLMYNSGNMLFGEDTLLYEHSPRSMVTATINLPKEGQFAGISLDQGGYANIKVGLHRQGGKLYLRTIKNNDTSTGTSISIGEINKETFELKVVLDDMFIEAFVDDAYSLTSHVNAQLGGTRNISVTANGGSLSNVNIYRLATLDNIYD